MFATSSWGRSVAGVTAALLVAGGLAAAGPAEAAPARASDPALLRSPELSETSRLTDRRTVVTGDRAWVLGSADGRFPAAGFHTRGEMGGFWTPSLKLLDGVWFGIGDQWIGKGTQTTSGWGYVRTDFPAAGGVAASRTDFVPDGVSGALVGLTLRSASTRTITLRADAHSELMGSYPWGETTPSQTTVNLPDSGAVDGNALVFRDQGTPPGANQTAHDWAAAFGSSVRPTTTALGKDFRGPQDPAVVCPASGTGTPGRTRPLRRHRVRERDRWAAGLPAPAQGRRADHDLVRRRRFPLGHSRRQDGAGRGAGRPGRGASRPRSARREKVAAATDVSLPGDPLVEQSVAWSKQMLAASVQRSDDVALRVVNAGKAYPPPVKTLDSMRWIGAGWPDYTWLFGTDGEYTAFASVAAGQFAPIKAHLRTLRDVSEAVNGGSGKIVHEVTPDGAVYFGSNADAGNTDESAKYPSAVALVWRWSGDRKFLRDLYPASVRAMKHVASLDTDDDGWPEGLGNVERKGMGTGEAGQHRVHDPRLRRPRRPGRGPWRQEDAAVGDHAGAAADRGVREGVVVRRRRRPLVRGLARPGPRRRPRHEDLPAALDRADPDRRRPSGAACSRSRRRWPPTRTPAPRWPSTSAAATPASSGCTTPARARTASAATPTARAATV